MDDKSELKTKGLETYATDMSEAFQGGEPGLVKKMIHSQEEEELAKKKESKKSIKNKLFGIFGAMFLVIAVGVVVAMYMLREEVEVVYVPPQLTPLILTDKTDNFDVISMDRIGVYSLLRPALENFDLAPGELKSVTLREGEKPVDFARFIALIQGSFPLDQADVVDSNFMIGSFGQKTEDPGVIIGRAFILLRVRSFIDIFPPMRLWEKKMFFDLSPIFGILTTPENESLLTKDFEDGFISNKNARILYDQAGVPVLMYVFIDDNDVIIANSKDTITEVMTRLSMGEIRK